MHKLAQVRRLCRGHFPYNNILIASTPREGEGNACLQQLTQAIEVTSGLWVSLGHLLASLFAIECFALKRNSEMFCYSPLGKFTDRNSETICEFQIDEKHLQL